MVAHFFNLSTWKVKAGVTLQVQSLPGLYNRIQDIQGYKGRPYFKTATKTMYVLKVQINCVCYLSLVLTPRDRHENNTEFLEEKSKPQRGMCSFRFAVERARIQGQKAQACSLHLATEIPIHHVSSKANGSFRPLPGVGTALLSVALSGATTDHELWRTVVWLSGKVSVFSGRLCQR